LSSNDTIYGAGSWCQTHEPSEPGKKICIPFRVPKGHSSKNDLRDLETRVTQASIPHIGCWLGSHVGKRSCIVDVSLEVDWPYLRAIIARLNKLAGRNVRSEEIKPGRQPLYINNGNTTPLE
jgi:hypothetical protein